MALLKRPKPKHRKKKPPPKHRKPPPKAKGRPVSVPPNKTAPPPAPADTTTTTTSTTGLPSSAVGQLAQDAGQLEADSQAAQDYETGQQMVTTPSTTAPANANQDTAAQAAATALQSFYGSGSADAPQYAPSSNVYAAQVAASSGAENNPT